MEDSGISQPSSGAAGNHEFTGLDLQSEAPQWDAAKFDLAGPAPEATNSLQHTGHIVKQPYRPLRPNLQGFPFLFWANLSKRMYAWAYEISSGRMAALSTPSACHMLRQAWGCKFVAIFRSCKLFWVTADSCIHSREDY